MKIEELLRDEAPAILAEAERAIAQVEHYRRDGEEAVRLRVEALYEQLAEAVRTRDLEGLLEHAGRIARERFDQGFDLGELHTAFGALEEAIWRRAVVQLPPDELAWGLGLVSTALTHGKIALGRAFAALTAPARARSVDLSPIFEHAEYHDRSADDLVYPV